VVEPVPESRWRVLVCGAGWAEQLKRGSEGDEDDELVANGF
jgi:hypothetical protein